MKRTSGLDPGILALLNAPHEELDYGFVIDCLGSYSNPRVKLNHLLKIDALTRIKKGIYIIGKNIAQERYSSETLANMIYGPSYVSLEWACQYYRLIPEKVTTVTSITTQRSRRFQTPIGLFTYEHLPLNVYPIGVTLTKISDRQQALMATKEKALCDLLVLRRGAFTSKKQFHEALYDDLRIEEDDVGSLDLAMLKSIYQAHPHSAIGYLIQCKSLIQS